MTSLQARLPPAEDPPAPRRACRVARALTVVAGTWLVVVLAHTQLSGRWSVWTVPALLPPITFVVVPVLLGLAALLVPRRRRVIAATALAALLVGLPWSGLNPAAVVGGTPDRVAGTPVRVVSMNTDYFAQVRDGLWAGRRDRGALVAYLRSLDADVYLLQEHQYRVDGRPVPRNDDVDQLRREFPGYEPVVVGEFVTLSRLPIVGAAPLASRDVPALTYPRAPYTLRVGVRVGDEVLSTYNVHVPVQIVLEENPLRAGFYRELADRADRRAEEYRALTAAVVADPNPVLVAGDFNTSPAMNENRDLLAVTRDAARSSADPYPTSWQPGSLPALWRVDWALTRGAVGVRSAAFVDSAGNSDHDAQSLELAVPQGTRP